MEAAIGEHRLLVWELGEAERKLAGQYYVAAGGRFLMDDVPSERRAELQRVLDGYRKQSGR
jgi:predicted oxidoreductase